MSEPNRKDRKVVSRQTVILVTILVVVIAAAAVVIYMLLNREPETEESFVVARIITEENLVDISQDLRLKVEEGSFETHMNVTWTFPDGESPSIDAIMGNSSSNRYDFYFTVTLETGEVVLTSNLLPIGTQMAEVKLDTPLEAGTYPSVVKIHMVDEDGNETSGNMGISVTLIVLG